MAEQEFETVKQELPGVEEGVLLKDHTTFRIGGPAKYFFAAKTSDDVERAVSAAQKLHLRFLILSGGSNVLISDDGFDGLVIKVEAKKFEIQGNIVWAEAGVEMKTLVKETGERGLKGLEWAGGLPGTVGGAVRGNAGAFEGETDDNIKEVEALDELGKRKVFSRDECAFSYRSSIFKEKEYTVLSVTLQMEEGDKDTIQKIAESHVQYRKEKHPDLLEYPNAGSIFKNCNVENVPDEVREQFKDVIKLDPFPVIPVAAMIARAGLQGMRVGDAEVSQKHPNYIVNCGNATAKDVIQLIANVKKEIKNKFDVDLEEELSFPH